MEEKDYAKRRLLILVYLTGLFFLVTIFIEVWYLWLIGLVVFILILRQYRQFIEKEFPLQPNLKNEKPSEGKTHKDLGNIRTYLTDKKYVRILTYVIGVGALLYSYVSGNMAPFLVSLVLILLAHSEYRRPSVKKESKATLQRGKVLAHNDTFTSGEKWPYITEQKIPVEGTGAGIDFQSESPDGGNQMKRWEYHMVFVLVNKGEWTLELGNKILLGNEIPSYFNSLGSKGWECFSVVEQIGDTNPQSKGMTTAKFMDAMIAGPRVTTMTQHRTGTVGFLFSFKRAIQVIVEDDKGVENE